MLIRFQDVLRAQVRRINEAFRSAIAESSYGNVYRGIYPIKVNQLHEVVDELLDAGRPYGMGLECGSKAELIACLPQIDGETLLVCNGVKDRTMLSLILSAQRLASIVLPVVERYAEFDQLAALAERAEHSAAGGAGEADHARIGPMVRVRRQPLKFGLTTPDLVLLLRS
jgi:arginine decarboxylase